MNYQIITKQQGRRRKKVENFNTAAFKTGEVYIKSDVGRFYVVEVNHFAEKPFYIKECYEEELVFNRWYWSATNVNCWRTPSDEEKAILDDLFKPYHCDDKIVEHEIECFGHSELKTSIEKLPHKSVIVTDIDYQKCEISYICGNCGARNTISFFKSMKQTCPVCENQENRHLATTFMNLCGDLEQKIYVWGHNALSQTFDIFPKPMKEPKMIFKMSDENTFKILSVNEEYEVKDNSVVLKFILDSIAEYSVSGGGIATKISEGVDTTLPFHEALNINLNSFFLNSKDVIWEGADTPEQFIIQHQTFFKNIGFFSFWDEFICSDWNIRQRHIEVSMFEYLKFSDMNPAFSKLIKNGHILMAIACFDYRWYNYGYRWYDNYDIDRWERYLLGNDVIPSYVQEYLAKTKASYEEYCFWCENWVILNLSEEEFNSFVGDAEYTIFKLEVGLNKNVVLLTCYGYGLNELKHYLITQCCSRPDEDLLLYIEKCEKAGIEPEKFPVLKECLANF